MTSPVLIGAGFAGYGGPYRQTIDLSAVGGLVTGPITLRPNRPSRPAQMVELADGLILEDHLHNPGVKKVLQQYQKLWQRIGLPMIAHLPFEPYDDLARTARVLDNLTTGQGASVLAGLELGLPVDAVPQDVSEGLAALRHDCDLPIWVKLPFQPYLELWEAAVDEGAHGLVVSQPPQACGVDAEGRLVDGLLYGTSGLYPQILHQVRYLAQQVNLPIIAAGGVAGSEQVAAYLAAGASAVQLDVLLWRDPNAAVAASLKAAN